MRVAFKRSAKEVSGSADGCFFVMEGDETDRWASLEILCAAGGLGSPSPLVRSASLVSRQWRCQWKMIQQDGMDRWMDE